MDVRRKEETIYQGISLLIKHNPDIKAIVSIGSFSQGRFDEFSDIDLYLFTNRAAKYKPGADDTWLNCFDNILSIKYYIDQIEKVNKIRFILDGGLMYELTIVSLQRFSIVKYFMFVKKYGMMFLIPPFIRKIIQGNIFTFIQTIRRGYKIHHDLINLAGLLSLQLEQYQPKRKKIDSVAFENNYTTFWHSCYTASVKLIRGEYYHNSLLYDTFIRNALFRIIEWSTWYESPDTDTFFNGYKIDKWAGRRIYDDLIKILPHGNLVEMQESLLQAIEIYQRYSCPFAEANGFTLNKVFEAFVIDFVRNVAIPATAERADIVIDKV